MNADTQNSRFAAWLDDHHGIVVKIARSFASGRDVDDLVQEILLNVWKSVPSYRGDAATSTWVYRVALNRALTWQRAERTKAARSKPVAQIADFASPDTSAAAQRLEQVYSILRAFPEIDRSLVLLSLEGCSYIEMSEITGITSTNVGARLSRARTRLTQELEASQ